MKITNLNDEAIDIVSHEKDLWIIRACLRETAFGIKPDRLQSKDEDLPDIKAIGDLCEKISHGLNKRIMSYKGF
jgi:hypothetical protein